MVAALAAQATPPTQLTLGIYSFKKRTEVWKQFQPVTQELSRLMSAQLGTQVTVELSVPPSYEECLDQFVAGKIDIVRFGPASYVLAKQRAPGVQLLAAEREDAKGVGLIVVRDDSPITSLAQLAGKKFAFGDSQSTIGRYLSQAELVKAGILQRDLEKSEYLDRHDNVFKSVEIGDHDAGALHADTFKELNAKAAHKLRVLHPFDNAPKPWLARPGLALEITNALTASLLRVADPESLKALKVPGFAVTSDAEFEIVRTGMAASEKFAPAAAATPAKEPAPAPAPAPNKG